MATMAKTRCGHVWFVLVLPALTSVSLGQDPVKIAPDVYQTALANEHVRVHNVTLKAGDKIAIHSHPDHLVYAISDGKLRFGYADGTTKDVDIKKGTVTWIKAESHTSENTGASDFKAVVFELNKPAQVAAQLAKAPEGQDAAKLTPDNVKVLLENDRVRVLDVHLKPGVKEPLHWHPHHVGYALTDARLKSTTEAGKTTEKVLSAGEAVWNEPVTHTVENPGDREVHVLAVEMREPITSPSKAP